MKTKVKQEFSLEIELSREEVEHLLALHGYSSVRSFRDLGVPAQSARFSSVFYEKLDVIAKENGITIPAMQKNN